MWKRQRLAMRLLEVREEIPREVVADYRRCSESQLESLIPRFGTVQVEQDVPGGIAATNIVYDLILRLLAVERRIETKSVLKKAQLGTNLIRLGELGLQIEIRTREAVTVSTEGRCLELE